MPSQVPLLELTPDMAPELLESPLNDYGRRPETNGVIGALTGAHHLHCLVRYLHVKLYIY
jgi:hypothetical protein